MASATAFGGPTAEIGQPMGGLTLHKALALTLARSPELAVVDHDVRIAEARVLQAGLVPNPELEFTSENVNRDQMENTLLFGQLIELGAKRSARVREARFGSRLAAFDYETKKREVLLKTAEHFVDLLAAQRRVAINEESVRIGTDFAPQVQRRLEAGKASDLEKIRFEVAIASARIDLEQSRRDVAMVRNRLAAQWGSRDAGFTAAIGNLEATPGTPPLDLLERRLPANPRLARFDAVLAQHEAGLAREKAAAVPDVTLRAGPRRLAETNDTTAVVSLGVPLPLWNHNQGNVHAANEQVRRAQTERSVAAVGLRTELSDAYQALGRSRSAIEILRENVLPGAESALAATSDGYEAGRFSYLDVLDARRTVGAARLQYIGALTDFHKALQRIEALTTEPRSQNIP